METVHLSLLVHGIHRQVVFAGLSLALPWLQIETSLLNCHKLSQLPFVQLLQVVFVTAVWLRNQAALTHSLAFYPLCVLLCIKLQIAMHVHCRLFHWFLGKCFLVEIHPYMTCFCTFWQSAFSVTCFGEFFGRLVTNA